MSVVFADTFYFLGQFNPTDHAHAICLPFASGFRGTVVTTMAVLLEFGDALASPVTRIQCAESIRDMQGDPQFRIVPLTPELFQKGLAFYTQRRDKKWSLTDCISFMVMRNGGITEALTGDKDFEQAGFRILLK